MIRCSDVTKSYRLGDRQVDALRGVDLTIEGPGFFAIMGASGSGKSTLLHLMGGLDSPDRGTIAVAGVEIQSLDERQLCLYRQRQVGIVFQQFNLLPTLTALENIELPGILAGATPASLRPRTDELLGLLGLEHRATHRPDALSGGEQQRVAIARALHASPPVLLADEPTGNLDSASAARLWKLLKNLTEQYQLTVVMVTHEPEAAAWCQQVFVLRDGCVTGQFKTEDLDAAGVATRYQQLVRAA